MAKKSFEQTLKELEEVVEELEKGDIPLEKAIRKFEDGMKLSRQCSDMLEETERKISLLVKGEEGEPLLSPFSDGNGSDSI
jgi:exodeoxyribonuclease VII small subunit